MKYAEGGLVMNYRLLLFDLDGTLFDYKKAQEHAFGNTFTSIVKKEDELKTLHKLYQEINDQVWDEFQADKLTADQLRVERFIRLLEQSQIEFDPIKVSKTYTDNLSRCSFLLDGALELVSELADKFKLALITNGLSDVQRSRIANSELDKYFKHVFISEEIGSPKPNPDIFDYALSKVGSIEKKETIVIGDSISSDILGGNNFGIDTCWFNPENLPQPADVMPTYTAKSYEELKAMLNV
jgi:putative hydrolase of the HAD superfamily